VREEMFGVVRFDPLWIVSRVARRRFMILAACSPALGILLVLMTYQPRLFDEKQQPIAVRIVEIIVAFPAIVGGLCMFFAMAWSCLELDTSGAFVRVLLAFLMLCTAPFGQIVYYFLVYRPQTAHVAMRII
jgi:ABC-type multidrug transport system permease subunit